MHDLNSPSTHPVYQYVRLDAESARKEYQFKVPVLIRPSAIALLVDPRDEPCLHLLFNVAVTALPAAALMFAACSSHWVGLAYFLCNYALYLQRFMLTLHFTEHRRLFKPEVDALNLLVPHLLCMLYGVPSGVYRLHHCIMHHVEDNHAPHDLSSTEPYQRDNLLHFAWYWFRHAVLAWGQLPAYAYKQQRYSWCAGSLTSESAYLLFLSVAWRLNAVATIWVLLVPYLVTTFAAMFGNWSQHVFVDPDRGADNSGQVGKPQGLNSASPDASRQPLCCSVATTAEGHTAVSGAFTTTDSNCALKSAAAQQPCAARQVTPASPYRSTYNLVGCADNLRTYNDGYHILHHLNSRAHWSTLPQLFLESLDAHDREDALVFHSLGFFDIGLAVFTGRLHYLARHIVPCGARQAQRSEEQWVQLLRHRLQPVRCRRTPRPRLGQPNSSEVHEELHED